ncbi:serine/threonine protein kinase [Tuwongella immobilis]|uniref:non-specific serine/threonine protein kinase n=1 Tax=Tuwongella immobilis TaxID=692036 RepID=A0A6C2YHL6_9BACT|nr:serine/threonine-protein kinase [Tuwongella immobilis]VIP01020.1 serine threonine protein kinase : Serine/threonine protein kinase OS=Pirellula staleyi (strain ATCC 27377 / DSM 6068 / ICPB 4128) GN=Psta_4044 PE=3 SV=1: Pkinase [Tuwongella immobilis]VTR97465.1 serine threonine protein kinase : Serine/threonine protein kinase OS=Pirellula staleyi (strain ATCC 27377 / DSM 6068 / ICPB 4128) GN=Psta_4044 PE=3 SV=1: Pkinase [Tuwongella immobilis]
MSDSQPNSGDQSVPPGQMKLPPSHAPTIVHSGDMGTLQSPPPITPPNSADGTGPTLPKIPGYEIQGELGRGGMGIVYKAVQPSLRRTVALKVLLSGTLASPQDRKRFQLEAESAGSLIHPNIVNVFDFGEIDGKPFFSMQYVEGHSLADRVRRGALQPMEAARLVATIARALEFAHERGVLHRDLKPHNILLNEEEHPYLTDFGLARRVDEPGKTQTGTILGTPAYMPPEQAQADTNLTPATDIYSLGAVLYECITGKPPFEGDHAIEIIAQVIDNPPVAPREINPEIPRDLETICLKCLEKDPLQRYASADELANDLQRFLNGESIQARSLNLMERMVRAIEHDRLDEEFAKYGSLFCWYSLVMAIPEVMITFIILNDLDGTLLALVQFSRAALFVILLAWYRNWKIIPQTATERHLWSVWGGYLVCCFVIGFSNRMLMGWETKVEPRLYISLAPMTALAFISIASRFWGGFYVCAACFMLLPVVMVQDLRWAALEFGALWAVILFTIGLRLQKLAAAYHARSHSQ